MKPIRGNRKLVSPELGVNQRADAILESTEGTKRIRGTVEAWFEKFGWIQVQRSLHFSSCSDVCEASQEIDHPDVERNQGKIYLLAEDVQEDLPGVGCAVTFFLYQDANGLGAMNVRPDGAPGRSLAPKPRWQGKAQPQVSPGPFRGGYAPGCSACEGIGKRM